MPQNPLSKDATIKSHMAPIRRPQLQHNHLQLLPSPCNRMPLHPASNANAIHHQDQSLATWCFQAVIPNEHHRPRHTHGTPPHAGCMGKRDAPCHCPRISKCCHPLCHLWALTHPCPKKHGTGLMMPNASQLCWEGAAKKGLHPAQPAPPPTLNHCAVIRAALDGGCK